MAYRAGPKKHYSSAACYLPGSSEHLIKGIETWPYHLHFKPTADINISVEDEAQALQLLVYH